MLKRQQQGFTLIDVIMGIVLAGIVLFSATFSMRALLSRSTDSLLNSKSVVLAEAYLEEMLAKNFDETTPVGGSPPCVTSACTGSGSFGNDGENRPNFDDVDDFHNLETGVPLDALGQIRADYNLYEVSINVEYLSAAEVINFNLNNPQDGKWLQISITPPSQDPIVFTVLKGNY